MKGNKTMDDRKLHDELTEFHIMALYDFMVPLDYGPEITWELMQERKKAGIDRYRKDPIFNRRVSLMVSGTIRIIKRNK